MEVREVKEESVVWYMIMICLVACLASVIICFSINSTLDECVEKVSILCEQVEELDSRVTALEEEVYGDVE